LAAGELVVESIAFFIELKSLQQIIRIGASAIEFRDNSMASFTRILSGREVDCRTAPIISLKRLPLFSGLRPQTRASRGPGCACLPVFPPWLFCRRRWGEKAEDFSLFDGKIHAAQSSYGAVILIKAFDLDNGSVTKYSPAFSSVPLYHNRRRFERYRRTLTRFLRAMVAFDLLNDHP